MKSGFGRLVLAALIGVAFVSGPALADQLDTPLAWQTIQKPSSVRLRVKAGASGADAGFTAQWMKKVDFDANGGWAAPGDSRLMQGDFTGAPDWVLEGNAGDYTLAPSQWMSIELGQLFEESGVVATDTDELEPSTQYVVRVFARGTAVLDASAPTADIVVQTLPAAQNCTFTLGYWKTHPAAWPTTSLTLGSVNYTAAELQAILNTSPSGNGLIILAHQLIAAKLNILNGADGTVVNATIAAADAQIGALVVPPTGGSSDSLTPASVNSNSHILDDWNNGITGPGHCAETPATPSTWGKIKSQYRN